MSIGFPNSIDTLLNPSASTPLDANLVNPQLRHSTQHSNLNDAVVAIETKLGVNLSSTQTSIDYIVNLLLLTATEHPKGVKRRIINPPFPTQIIWFQDAGETIKLVEKKRTYDSNKNITKIELFLYDGTISNNILRTITDDIELSGPFEVARTRTVT